MKVVFMGTPHASVPSLEKILNVGHDVLAVYTQPDRPSGRGNKLTPPPVKQFALENNLLVLQPSSIRNAETLELFQSHNADAAIVVAYGRILPEGLLNAFPKGAINVHFSLLPKYRGAAPVNWAIVQGERVTGVTTMKMDIGLDTGDILLQEEVRIGAEENAIELMQRLSFIGADLLAETLEKLEEIKPRPQNHVLASLAPMIKKEDGLINWNLTAPEIFNRVRGFQPFPTSFTRFNGKKLTIWKATVSANAEFKNRRPGEIIQAKGDNLVVLCADETCLKIDELQLEGKNRMRTRDFLNGMKPVIGEKLG